MPRLSFSKASLHKESARLKRYQQYLPSLDLKRQRLIIERYKAGKKQADTELLIGQCRNSIAENLPMLSDTNIDLSNLVTVAAVKVGNENIVGIHIPVLEHIDMQSRPYSTYTKPHWVDFAVVQLKSMLELKIQLQIDKRRLEILEQAVKKITQRVNLFDKVLIPRAQKNIKKIHIFLSDAERASVVRAKITKQKRQKTGLA